jgi:7-cyano-7-deazaguanine synthase
MGKISKVCGGAFMKSYLVVFSGGLDSTCALYWAKAQGEKVVAVNFAYGSNHEKKECAAAKKIAAESGIELLHVNLDFFRKHFFSALLGGIVPQGEYQPENMKSTVVPFRNGIMLSVAAGIAESRGLDAVVLGNHGGDHFIYPDCRPGFISAMNDAISAGTDGAVKVISPFCDMDKADIVRVGAQLGVDFGQTYSCYQGGDIHCGKCATCLERKAAFIASGVKDPTIYKN